MIRTPDGNGRFELVKCHSLSRQGRQPERAGQHAGYLTRRIPVEDIGAVVAGLRVSSLNSAAVSLHKNRVVGVHDVERVRQCGDRRRRHGNDHNAPCLRVPREVVKG